jgi:error-prone DNA polymerase
VGWFNPPVAWGDLERTLSWGKHGDLAVPRPAREPRPPVRPPNPVRYAELHCHSSFSFLDGVSDPEVLAWEAVNLGLTALAVTDHDGLYGASRLAQGARGLPLATVFGAELNLGLTARRGGQADPAGTHLLVLARGTEGYRRLAGAITAAQLAGGEKGMPRYDLADLAAAADGSWAVLTGCRKGPVRSALRRHGATGDAMAAVEAELHRLADLFGRDNVFVELIDQDLPADDAVNDLLAEAARRAALPTLATNNVHYARPADHLLANVVAAIRARRTLDEMEPWLCPAPTAHLRSGAEMAARFARFPGVLDRAADLAEACAFDFKLVTPDPPAFPVPPGHDEASFLTQLVYDRAPARYGTREENPKAYGVLDREIKTIIDRKFPGYFLIVDSLAEFCRREDILCQGRGSAANSAVCYVLGITGVDAVHHNLLFERFLSPAREGYPDIDLDIESGRREEVIQEVYRRYGRHRAAQVANVITYRPKMALRDAARAFGYSLGTQDAWARRIDPHGSLPGDQTAHDQAPHDQGTHDQASHDQTPAPHDQAPDTDGIPAPVLEIARRLENLPRHLGIHSGGMVIADRPVGEVCPIEWARMQDRSVLQWDKDDCADNDLVKFDLLGLGMLSALHDAFDLVRDHHGVRLGLGAMPKEDDRVYEMIQEADTIGLFQIESRAQLSALPRLRPREFYDLVVQVAIIRPGPIQGGAVHPYFRRRNGQEEPDPPHPLLEKTLKRTLGVPLFQEQVMQIAIDAAGFSAAEADQLRRSMSSKRFDEKMSLMRERLLKGMADNGITGDLAEDIYRKLLAFSSYGFPESHAISFAYLVWASAYLKRHYPAAFTTALLRNQPMGFYSPASLIADVRHHDVTVRGVDVNASQDKAVLEPLDREKGQEYKPTHKFASGIPQPAIRLGLATVRHLGSAAEQIAAERARGGPYQDLEDFVRRADLPRAALEALATAGAFGCFGMTRRAALWAVGALAGTRADHLPGTAPGAQAPPLPAMTAVEQTFADLWATGSSPDSHPIQHIRPRLQAAGVAPIGSLAGVGGGRLVRVAGVVTHRQRPPTAGGTCFLSLEDETGVANVICPAKLWERQRRTALDHAALLITGVLEKADGAMNVVAGRIEPLRVAAFGRSRDFR